MIMNMTQKEFERAVAMWGLAMCLLAAAAGWVFLRFGQAWSIADLPVSGAVEQIVPAYVVTEVAMIPIGGKLIDRYGCRCILAVAPFLFIISSMLCMITPTVPFLVICRTIQGAGAGLILALGFTSAAKFYDLDKRGKCNELMTAAFAIGSLFSSSAGYFLTETFNWRTGFAVLSLIMFIGFILAWRFLPEDKGTGGRIDLSNMVITALAFAVVTIYTQMANVVFDVLSVHTIMFVIIEAMLVGYLIYHSNNSHDPTIPRNSSLFVKEMFALMFIFSLCGLGLIQYFFKLYLTYYDFDIYKATAMFLFMLAGAACTSMPGVRFVYKTGCRPWIIAGSAMVTLSLMFTHLFADKGIALLALSLFLFGIGLGSIVTEIICSLQTVIKTEEAGLFTGNLMAMRMVAILTGNTIIGAYINDVIRRDEPPAVIDISATDNALRTVGEYISDTLQYLANSMDDGFLMTAIILAMITTVLTSVVYMIGRDDVKAIESYTAESSKENEIANE